MTPQEVLAEAARVGLVLKPEGALIHYQGPLTPELRKGITAHKDRILACLKLREIHRAMGFPEEDVLFIEAAVLSGKVNEIRIACRPTSQEAA